MATILQIALKSLEQFQKKIRNFLKIADIDEIAAAKSIDFLAPELVSLH